MRDQEDPCLRAILAGVGPCHVDKGTSRASTRGRGRERCLAYLFAEKWVRDIVKVEKQSSSLKYLDFT